MQHGGDPIGGALASPGMDNYPRVQVDQVIGRIGVKSGTSRRAVKRAAGSIGKIDLGKMSMQLFSSRAVRYSRTARVEVAGLPQATDSSPDVLRRRLHQL